MERIILPMPQDALLRFTAEGIYCPQADVYIDPWRRVPKALITHAHSDHARWGMEHYLAHHDSVPVLRLRLGRDISVQGVAFGEKIYMNGVEISFHPAGHIIGSAQIRLAYQGEVWVVSGDYKVEDDGFCAPFEAVPCQHFITESTFGLPVYHWRPQEEIFADINQWWAQNAAEGKISLLSGYSLGKAQRILQGLDRNIGPVYTHGAIENTNEVLREAGIALKPTQRIHLQGEEKFEKKLNQNAMIVAPPGAIGSNWSRRFQPFSLGIASGWMQIRGARRRRAADRGFVLSDHADWPGLNQAIEATGAEHVYVTHGYTEIFSRWLREKGLDAQVVKTEFEGELGEINEGTTADTPAQEG
ncbi:MAG: ligase-associated DNA damage response exonuclease [Bacteroidota bacterium]